MSDWTIVRSDSLLRNIEDRSKKLKREYKIQKQINHIQAETAVQMRNRQGVEYESKVARENHLISALESNVLKSDRLIAEATALKEARDKKEAKKETEN